MEDSGLIWSDDKFTIHQGRWRQQNELNPFKVSAYWHNLDTIGILTERSTGRSFIVSKDLYGKSRWRME